MEESSTPHRIPQEVWEGLVLAAGYSQLFNSDQFGLQTGTRSLLFDFAATLAHTSSLAGSSVGTHSSSSHSAVILLFSERE